MPLGTLWTKRYTLRIIGIPSCEVGDAVEDIAHRLSIPPISYPTLRNLLRDLGQSHQRLLQTSDVVIDEALLPEVLRPR